MPLSVALTAMPMEVTITRRMQVTVRSLRLLKIGSTLNWQVQDSEMMLIALSTDETVTAWAMQIRTS